jgi:hypothetical protein
MCVCEEGEQKKKRGLFVSYEFGMCMVRYGRGEGIYKTVGSAGYNKKINEERERNRGSRERLVQHPESYLLVLGYFVSDRCKWIG